MITIIVTMMITGDEENESQEDTDIEQYADEDEESEEMQDDAGQLLIVTAF